jgi:hypothetical protein
VPTVLTPSLLKRDIVRLTSSVNALRCQLPQSGKPSCGYADNKVGVFAAQKISPCASLSRNDGFLAYMLTDIRCKIVKINVQMVERKIFIGNY